jgi:hypothetical protein
LLNAYCYDYFSLLLPLAHHGAACSGNRMSVFVRWPGRLALASVPHHNRSVTKKTDDF